MKFILTALLILVTVMANGQIKKVTKSDLADKWFANNKDSVFYKFDTIKFYRTSNIVNLDSLYCIYKVWTFSKGNKISQGGLNNCLEPPISTVEANPVFFTKRKSNSPSSMKYKSIPKIPNRIRLIEKNGTIFLLTYYEEVLLEKYKVISKEEMNYEKFGGDSFIITVVRQKK